MKVLLVPGGSSGWAFDNRAKDLAGLTYEKIKVDLKYLGKVSKRDISKYDIIYPFSLNVARKLYDIGIPLEKMATGITSTRVFTKHMNSKGAFSDDFLNYLKQFRGINTVSDEFVNIFKPYIPIYKTRYGINENMFIPKKQKNDKFTIGWVGRIDITEYRKLKGYDLVVNAVKDLDVVLDIRTFENRVPRDDMVTFYQGLNCFICSSSSEHIPLPVLEAASCGVPIIATNVGIVPELIKHNENGLIVERSVSAIKKAATFLMNNPKIREQFSENIRKTIVENWTLEKCKPDFESFLISIMK